MADPSSPSDEQTLLADGPAGDHTPDAPRRGAGAQLARGSMLGRYLVLERIGVGGMGEVYAAYDPELDRKVAIKLLHATPGVGSTSTGGATRLIREAQAMARLTNPHVITVHDVGTFDHQVFMAMEFVEGRTLGQWLEDEKPSWREALKVMVKAGRGLAAAHQAGLIHRDFKPDNVLLGHDQRVLVADFGLARASSASSASLASAMSSASSASLASRASLASSPESERAATPAESSSTLDTRMTVTGAIMGTPAYMSPEAHMGALVDASGDQFGFCVALYEALYGERPYAGDTMAALTFQVLHGQVREPPAGTKVPGWLRRVVLRGLSRDPKDRYPDMDALIRALVHDVGRERRRLGIAAAALVALLGGVGVGVALLDDEEEDPTRACVAAELLLVDVWDDARKQEIRAAIEASQIEYGPQTWRALERTLDAYTGEWLAMHRNACEATYVRQEQSVRMLDLQVACLGDRLKQLRGLTELLDQPDRQLLANVDQMAVDLPRVARCGDAQVLLARVPPPEDARVVAELEQLRGQLARVSAMRSAERLEIASTLAEQLVTQAIALDYAPVEAEALYERGCTRAALDQPDTAETDLSLAVSTAIASGHDELIAKAGISLVRMLVTRQHRLREADHWQGIAAAGIEHLGGDVMLESELLIASSRGLTERSEFVAALTAASEALTLREQLLGPDHLELVPALQAVARVYFVQNEIDKMEATYQRALHILEPHYGPDHPALVLLLSNLAVAHLVQGRVPLAVESFERVLALRTQQLGPDHIATVDVRSNLGLALGRLGKHEQAEIHLRHVQEVYEQRYGSDNPDTGEAYVNLAAVVEVRDADLAIEYLQRAQKIFEADDSDQGRRLVTVLNKLFDFAHARGELEHSGELASRALDLSRTAYGTQHPRTHGLMLDMASVELARGDIDSARALIEPALIELEAGEDSVMIAQAYFLLGQVMVASGEREAGVAKVQAALTMLDGQAEQPEDAELGKNVARLRQQITTWLSAR